MAINRQQLAKVLSCHAWDPQGQRVAVCPNNDEVHVYNASTSDAAWQRIAILCGHDHLITSMDWSFNGNQLLTCSQDRSAIVWFSDLAGDWVQQRVVTRLRLAALCARWSPCAGKFAIGSSDKSVCICYYEAEHSWWACKAVKNKHSSSVLAVAWHPTAALIATASTDCKCRVINAALSGIDSQHQSEGVPAESHFGDVLLEIDTQSGWGTSVAWSPSGLLLAFTSHGSTIGIIDDLQLIESPPGFRASVRRERLTQLPARTIAFLSEDRVVAGGFDNVPLLLVRQQDGSWNNVPLSTGGSLPVDLKSTPTRIVSRDFTSKVAMFRSPQASKHSSSALQRGSRVETASAPHVNAIVDLKIIQGAEGIHSGKFSTAGWDGRVVVWDPAGTDLTELIGAVHL